MAKFRILPSDTDSFLLFAEGDYNKAAEVIHKHRTRFDRPLFPEGHVLRDISNQKVPGKVKFQFMTTPIREAVVLSPKCYSLLTENGNVSTAKGVQKHIQHTEYRRRVERQTTFTDRCRGVQQFNQELYQVNREMRILSPFDNKKYYLNINESMSYGHYRLEELAQ